MNPTILKHTRTFASLVAAGSLLAVPAIGQAAKPASPGKSGTHSKSTSHCKAHSIGFSLGGTLVSVTPDNPLTAGNEQTVALKITSANAAAKRSGDITDQDGDRKGVQVKGATYTIPASDAFVLRLNDYAAGETPTPAVDKVKVKGRIAMTTRKCAGPGASIADRLGAVDIRRVTISDRVPDVS